MKNLYEPEFINIIHKQDWLISALYTVRGLKLPDCFIAAGAVRNTVWNYFHNYPTRNHQNDIDVVYFDAFDMTGKREESSMNFLNNNFSKFKWEVVNQARAHLFHSNSNRPRVNSSSESIAYWSETPTCVGVRLEEDNSISVCAPHGLDDLMNLVVRPVPLPYQDLNLYHDRIKNKNWHKIWPKLKIFNSLEPQY